ncbi:methyl-accepting chemotaxis protein [Alkalilimnicola ehrlichii MLHE-1]|uniref:Methyl-accepting chemotaxis sensory transducer n=1 Tax=Alkalilimnicola ehrlichii (strain ATCC BAA-1101 / DSM 17681 / MLHE-1) TaxID=187272 RepID=Q0A9I5_ALKEH|nr:methyl-accepting chemotaxis protein [Alkalilimnicola ehrlichii]ABI56502.1 methyl-accepting chemotaxis sensory transducer [Alkalilimnicola ehrlichii MLHE-1]
MASVVKDNEERTPSVTMNHFSVIQQIAERTSGVGVEAVDIVNHIEHVAQLFRRQAAIFSDLVGTARRMSEANDTVDQAARRAHDVAASAGKDVERSRATITHSLEQIRGLAESVTHIEGQLSSLNEALQGVAQVANEISTIAKQTNLLALNATIEATRAGEVGRGFAVVAEHVKELAKQTADATSEIHQILEELTNIIERLIRRGAESTEKAQAVREGTHAIQEIMETVGSAMQDVDTESGRIHESVGEIDQHCRRTVGGLEELTSEVRHANDALEEAEARTEKLRHYTELLIRETAVEGVETIDTPYIRLAEQLAADTAAAFEEGLKRGSVNEQALFDQNYQREADTAPPRFTAANSEFCDRVLPAIQEPALQRQRRVLSAFVCDLGGYVPAQSREAARAPSADDSAELPRFHRRRLDSRETRAATRNRERFLLQTYRLNLGEGHHALVKEVSVPIKVGGRHWGCQRLIYAAD